MKSMGAMTDTDSNHGPIDKSDMQPEDNVKLTDEGFVDWEHELKKRVEDSDEQVEQEIEGMVEKYDGLVSMEAAPILVGREKYDVDLVNECNTSGSQGDIEIANVTYEMRSLEIRVSVEEVEDEYTKPDADWRVVNVNVEDTSGTTQLAFWNEDADKVKHLKGGYEEEMIIEGAYTKSEADESDYHSNMHDAPPIEIGDSTKVTVVYPDGEEEVIIEAED